MGSVSERLASDPRARTDGERDIEDVRRAVGQPPRRLAQPPGPRKGEHRLADDSGEGAGEMKARKAGHAGHIVERERLADVAFDVPERLGDRLHAAPSEAMYRMASRQIRA
jgi:hypothetical protein